MNYERLASDISSKVSDLIDRRNNDLLGVTNVQLVSLFWKTGKQVADYRNAGNRDPQVKHLISDISEELEARYGKLFSKRNVAKMKLFVEHFPNIHLAKDISRLLSWQHILLLMRVEDVEAKWLYVDLTIREGLSPAKLLDAIRSKAIERNSHQARPSRSKHHVSRWNDEWWGEMLSIGVKQQVLSKQMSANFFQNKRSPDFRKLLEPSNATELALKKTDNSSIKQDVLFQVIQEIEEFKKFHNWWLNGTLNNSFRQIGECLNKHVPSVSEGANKSNLLDLISKQLTTQYGSNFTADNLLKAVNFFQYVSDGVSDRINFLLTWEHLLVILPLREAREQLFYARLAATEGLSASVLRERINENTFLKTHEADKTEKLIPSSLQNPQIITKNNKSESKPLVIETLINPEHDIEESKLTLNIFENPHFPLAQWLKSGRPKGRMYCFEIAFHQKGLVGRFQERQFIRR